MEEKDKYRLEADHSIHQSETIKEYIDFQGLNFEKIADKEHLDLFVAKNIVEGKLSITEDVAKKLTKIIPKIPYTFWLSMQKHYDELYKKDQI